MGKGGDSPENNKLAKELVRFERGMGDALLNLLNLSVPSVAIKEMFSTRKEAQNSATTQALIKFQAMAADGMADHYV